VSCCVDWTYTSFDLTYVACTDAVAAATPTLKDRAVVLRPSLAVCSHCYPYTCIQFVLQQLKVMFLVTVNTKDIIHIVWFEIF